MSYYGCHPISEKEHVKKFFGYAPCRLCIYRARLALDGLLQFEEFICSRCGLKFPQSKIDEECWCRKIRAV